MDSTTPALNDPGPISTEVVPQFDRRSSQRTRCHTVVTTVMVDEDSPLLFKTQSEDISGGGAKLICNEPLPARMLLLRFLLPTHWDRLLEAEVLSESVCERTSLIQRRVRQYVYRVRFTGVEHKVDESR